MLPSGLAEACLQLAVNGYVLASDDGKIVYANRAIERMLGWDPVALVGKPLTTIMPPAYHAKHLEGFAHYLETGEKRVMGIAVGAEALSQDGKKVPINLYVNDIHHRGKRYFLGILVDWRPFDDIYRVMIQMGNTLEMLEAR